MIDNLSVFLVKPRFPENIGMAARACANMGCQSLNLVSPERWDYEKARVLATSQGEPILKNLKIFDDIDSALKQFHFICATTARLGGYRRNYCSPSEAALIISKHLNENQKVALLFGAEDKGLTNQELLYANLLIHVDCETGVSSLNLAQCVLILLYECRKNIIYQKFDKKNPRLITNEEEMRLENLFKTVLLKLDCLHGQNTEYFFQQWRNILRKASLKRNEYDAWMGFCRQILNKFKL